MTVPNAGLSQVVSTLRLTFREGGAYDFQTSLSGILSRLPAEGPLAEPLPLYSPDRDSVQATSISASTGDGDSSQEPAPLDQDSLPPAYDAVAASSHHQ